jgi:hypothetical protein
MPKLCEKEVTKRGIAKKPLQSAQILAALTGKPLRWQLGFSVQSLAGGDGFFKQVANP